MSDVVIRVEGLGKRYRIGERIQGMFRYGSLRDTLSSVFRRSRSSVFSPQSSDSIWALKDVSFEIKRGEIVGIIGRNGAGKSTLLKILSRITSPSEGQAEIRGRVGSLLEVGTGFHPELTGRENIHLNGAILGMRRAEIAGKLDAIVAFAEVEKFLDTPVKHYSSGMYVRLAFAVAAHLEPEILLVDEVLAVGDAAFQKKCLGKMGDVAKEGRTILFVSHNLQAVSLLCQRTLLLQNGRVVMQGKTGAVIGQYLSSETRECAEVVWTKDNACGSDAIKLLAVRVRRPQGENCVRFDVTEPITLEAEFWCRRANTRLNPAFHIYTGQGSLLLGTANLHEPRWGTRQYEPGIYRSSCTIPGNFLNKGRFFVTVLITRDLRWLDVDMAQMLSFEVVDTGASDDRGDFTGEWIGLLRMPLPWATCPIQNFSASSHGQTHP